MLKTGVLLLAAAAANGPANPPADLLLTGAAVYTMDPARSWAEAVAVREGRIVFVGTAKDAQAWRGPRTRVVELPGRMILPAFTTPTCIP
jgi:predicted amidohydrolase YtcJ